MCKAQSEFLSGKLAASDFFAKRLQEENEASKMARGHFLIFIAKNTKIWKQRLKQNFDSLLIFIIMPVPLTYKAKSYNHEELNAASKLNKQWNDFP